MITNDPHYREAAAACAAMPRETNARFWTPRPGDRVRCELPFKDTHGIGTVVAVNAAVAVVEIDGETLWYYPHELTFVGN